jgi:U3 small nucleolar RNA-associated protein 10
MKAQFFPSFMHLIKFCRDGDHSLPPSTNMKRRAQALILFVGYALKPRVSPSSEEEPISAVIAHLTTLATLTGEETIDTNIDEISEAARSSIHRLLSGMSVAIFIESVESMLKSGDAKVDLNSSPWFILCLISG